MFNIFTSILSGVIIDLTVDYLVSRLGKKRYDLNVNVQLTNNVYIQKNSYNTSSKLSFDNKDTATIICLLAFVSICFYENIAFWFFLIYTIYSSLIFYTNFKPKMKSSIYIFIFQFLNILLNLLILINLDTIIYLREIFPNIPLSQFKVCFVPLLYFICYGVLLWSVRLCKMYQQNKVGEKPLIGFITIAIFIMFVGFFLPHFPI